MSTEDHMKKLDTVFFTEYTSHDAILKYTRATAGFGVSYLLDNDYKAVYRDALEHLTAEVKARGLQIIEFGCGGGMNLVYLIALLNQRGIKIEKAVGTDFSPTLIDAARREVESYLTEEDRLKVEFHVARNESLVEDLAMARGTDPQALAGSFAFVIGVNTIRYCHRGQREMDCARHIKELLVPGGVCVVIDMNDRFPVFRSALKNHFRKSKEEECYIPSLEEYAAPFAATGFEILRKEHFCWIPHSGGKLLCWIMRGLSPLLSAVAPSRAMRSLVIVRKPLTSPNRSGV